MIPASVVLATGNPGKVAELSALVCAWGPVEVIDLGRFPGVLLPPETGATYAENARLKAEVVARASGLPALGDDSGLEVDALGGAPGRHSARWAGPEASDAERIARLLGALDGVPDALRTARFRCAVALAWPGGRVDAAEGEVAGRIVSVPAGDCGFGYDPVFVPEALARTFACVTPAEKDRLSHRARAVRALGDRLRRL